MPEGARPVEPVVDAPRRRAVHGDHVPEGRAQDPEAGKPGRAHGEVVVVRVEFDDDRFLDDVAVPRAHGGDGIFDESAHVTLEGSRLLLVRPQHQARALREIEPVQAVQHAQRVHHLGVVGVAFEGPGEVPLRVVETVDPQQVDPEGGVGAVEPGIHLDRPFEHGDSLLVTAGDDVEVRDGLEDRAMVGALAQRTPGPRTRDLAFQVVGRGQQRHRLEPRTGSSDSTTGSRSSRPVTTSPTVSAPRASTKRAPG